MGNELVTIEWKREQLWKGCILSSIAHAIMVAHYPNLSNEHSWDGINYSVQDTQGSRGTVTFHSDCMVAAFRNDKSERLAARGNAINAIQYFDGAPQNVLKIAEKEALQYLLDDINGNDIPLITTAFWGIGDDVFSVDTVDNMLINGGELLEIQILDEKEAIAAWREYYDMSDEQCYLLTLIYRRKIGNPSEEIVLSKDEIAMIGTDEQEGLDESKISFGEIGIVWES